MYVLASFLEATFSCRGLVRSFMCISHPPPRRPPEDAAAVQFQSRATILSRPPPSLSAVAQPLGPSASVRPSLLFSVAAAAVNDARTTLQGHIMRLLLLLLRGHRVREGPCRARPTRFNCQPKSEANYSSFMYTSLIPRSCVHITVRRRPSASVCLGLIVSARAAA